MWGAEAPRCKFFVWDSSKLNSRNIHLKIVDDDKAYTTYNLSTRSL